METKQTEKKEKITAITEGLHEKDIMNSYISML